MKQITSKKFKAAVKLDPAWASKLTEPVEITDYCDMTHSKITHLSPLLHFTGIDNEGDCAEFHFCKSLEIAEGNFAGFVGFSDSGVQKIRNLTCGRDKDGNSAYFKNCKSLKIAEGTYPGFVSFSYAGVTKIENLTCGKDGRGNSASFYECESLEIAQGHFCGMVSFSYSSITKIENLTCGKENNSSMSLKLAFCKNLKKIPISFNPKCVEADEELLEQLRTNRLKEAARKHLQTEIVEIEI